MLIRILLMLTTAIGIVAKAEEKSPTGAASAWTTDDPIVLAARSLMSEGKYKEATALLVKNADAKVPARAELIDLIGRVREDYDMTVDQFLDKTRKTIPDVSKADVDRWFAQKVLTAKMIDGQLMIFGSEPRNLLKLSDEAKKRAVNWNDKDKYPLEAHLAKVIEAAERTHDRYVNPVLTKCTYTLTVNGPIEGAKKGSTLRVWLPFPQEYERQHDVKLISSSPENPLIAPSKPDSQRTVYFEKQIEDPSKDQVFQIKFQYTCFADYPELSADKAQQLSQDFPKKYLEERPPHIVFTPTVRQIVRDVVGNETNPVVKARKLWDWETSNIRYAFEDEYSTIPSFVQKCLTNKRGDCGIQGTTFITLARAAGIPARWQSGWQTKPGEQGMHDWCEIYIDPWGWIVIDPSYGKRSSNDPRIVDYYFGHQDAYRMVVNTDYGRELMPPKHSLRSEPADFQRGEVELDGKNLYFDKWSYSFQVSHEDVK